MALSTKIECEEKAKLSKENAQHLGEKIASLESAKEQAIAENRRLQNEMSSVMRECAAANVDLEKARKEARDMKSQIQDYIEKVRDAEETLRQKEMERAEMLEHLRCLTVETSHLGSDNSSLESEARSVRESLQVAQERVADLENILSNKDQLLNSYEQRVSELTRTVADLESRATRLMSQRDELQSDLKSCKEVADSLGNQRDMLSEALSSLNNSKERLREECESLREECESLRSQLEREKSSSATLERLLSETRQETLQHSVTSCDLKTDVDTLKLKIRHLELSLDSTNDRLSNALKESDEQRQHILKLERTLTNFRFEHAKNSSASGGVSANLSQ